MATQNGVVADFAAVTSPRDGKVDVAAVCTAEAVRSTATVSIICSIDWGAGSTFSECAVPAPRGACPVHALATPVPFTVCSDVTAFLRDETTETDRRCTTFTS